MDAPGLFPDSASIEEGELAVAGVRATELAQRFGTPLVVYREHTLRARAREVRDAVPDARVVYGSKAFPNVAILRLFGRRVRRDVATLGELVFARKAGITGEQLVVHGNAKSEEELRAAAEAEATVVLDAEDEVERAAASGVHRVLVRVTLGVEADTHEAIQTGHHGSKFGVPPDAAVRAIEAARRAGLDVAGLHVHVGSQLADMGARRDDRATRRICRALPGRARLDPEARERRGRLRGATRPGGARDAAWHAGTHGRSARRPSVRRARPPGDPAPAGARPRARGASRSHAVSRSHRKAPRQRDLGRDRRRDVRQPEAATLRRPLHRAFSAARADEPATETVSIAGLHCESGDVLIDDVVLPTPTRRRPPRCSGNRGVRARHGLELQRHASPRRRPRLQQRGAHYPTPRDHRRPACPRATSAGRRSTPAARAAGERRALPPSQVG